MRGILFIHFVRDPTLTPRELNEILDLIITIYTCWRYRVIRADLTLPPSFGGNREANFALKYCKWKKKCRTLFSNRRDRTSPCEDGPCRESDGLVSAATALCPSSLHNQKESPCPQVPAGFTGRHPNDGFSPGPWLGMTLPSNFPVSLKCELFL